MPEVRRLLLALADRGEARAHHLRWSRGRRAHQARANRCHAARRTRAQPETPGPLRVPPALVELSAAEWARLAPLLPPRRPHVGRPRNDHRAVLGGILWVLRNRASWRDMPERFGNYSTAYKRYRLWSDRGLWERLLRVLRTVTDDGEGDVSL